MPIEDFIIHIYCGLPNDKAIWTYFQRHWRAWFPQLGARSTFVRQAANLWLMKWRLQRYWADRLGYAQHAVHVVDGFPLLVCHFRRAHFSKIFRGSAAYGHCASKAQTYYGFKGLLLIDERGVIGILPWCRPISMSAMPWRIWNWRASWGCCWETKASSGLN